MAQSLFTPSGQAEIIRASQKDDLITSNLQESLSDIIFKTAGNRIWLRWRGALQSSGKLLYYGLTTISNYQTMGEEYTGIVQVDGTLRKIPSKMARLLMILLDSCGHHLLLHLLRRLENELKQPTNAVRPEARSQLLQAIAAVRLVLPFVQRFHKAAFFLYGAHYHISKRATGIHYILARHWLPQRRSRNGFRLLGTVSLLYLLSYATHSGYTRWRAPEPPAPPRGRADREFSSSSDAGNSARCSLCMEVRRHTAATPCGHLFCWDCAVQWLQNSRQCPMCREAVQASRVVLLQNYDQAAPARHGFVLGTDDAS